MRRNAIRLVCLLGCGALLLAVQSVVLQYIFKQEKDSVQHFSPSWSLIRDVADVAVQSGFPLFILDASILQCLADRTVPVERPACFDLPRGQAFVQFGSLGQFATQKEHDFLSLLSRAGYKTSKLSVPNPKVLAHGLEVLIPTHYLITQKQNTAALHVVVFHERPGNFWWHAAAAADEEDVNKTDVSFSRLITSARSHQFVKSDGAYDKVEVLPCDVGGGVRSFAPTQFDTFVDEQPFIECNSTRARLFHTIHGRDETPEAELFRLKVHRLLLKVKQLLGELNVPFWISSGTCLGFFRQCDVIPYTTDVDIGVFIKDYKPEIISAFSTHDIPLTHLFGKVEDSYELSFRDRDVKLDIFFFYEEDDHIWNGGTQARTGKKFKYTFPKFKLCWTEFLDIKLRIPCETEKYIEANYGPNWFQPMKRWDWKASPPNVEENGIWPVEEWPHVIKLFPLPES
uniref:Fukutin n=1 Tax=Rhipicephalus appendiculatus TaxID=34631 RepID=A0A131Z0V3_RHIAP